MNGLDDLQKQFKALEKNTNGLKSEVPFKDLFTREFMGRYTSFSSIDDYLKAGGFKADSQNDFKSIPQDALDRYVSVTTKFRNWESMLKAATENYISKKLGL